jgi:hypothetical protein
MAVFVFISSLGGWLATRRKRKKLEQGLGHKVDDRDVFSIAAWMKTDDQVLDEAANDNSAAHTIESMMEGAGSRYGRDS